MSGSIAAVQPKDAETLRQEKLGLEARGDTMRYQRMAKQGTFNAEDILLTE